MKIVRPKADCLAVKELLEIESYKEVGHAKTDSNGKTKKTVLPVMLINLHSFVGKSIHMVCPKFL